MKIDDPKTLFERWFSAPIKLLDKQLERGEGAISGMMVALPLFERFIHIKKSRDATGRSFYEIMADELCLPSAEVAEEFWTTFRHGFCHTGMPFDKDRGGNPLPGVSFHHQHPKFPAKVTDKDGKEVFKIDPWKFIYHVHDLYVTDPSLLEQHSQAPLLPIHVLV